jgi:predicted permease
MPNLVQDFQFGLRVLRRNPGFTAVAVLSLAIGIGANTAIFNIINTTFLRALPYPDSDRLVHLSESTSAGDSVPVSYPNFLDWQRRQDVFSGMAIYHGAEGKLRTVRGTEIVSVQHVSADFFSVLGVQLAEGRAMRPEDDRPGAERVAWVTSEGLRRHFGGDARLVGRSFVLDGQKLTIAGILPPAFRFHRDADLFTAMAPFAQDQMLELRENRSNTRAIARLKPGVEFETARTQLEAIEQRLATDYPEANKGIGLGFLPLRDELTGDVGLPLFLLLGAVGLVLLIACVNVANMLLARSFAREREMAIRASLGAPRRRLVRQLLIESLTLAAVSGVIGALVGFWGYQFASDLVPSQIGQVVNGSGFDWRLLLFVLGVSLITGVVFGLVPAWQLSQIRPVVALKQASGNGPAILGRLRLSDLLVVGQVALALTLLIGAGLMIRSLHRLLQVDTGYEPTRVLTLDVAAPPAQQFWQNPASFTRHFESVLAPVQNLPGVEAAAMASGLPFTYSTATMPFHRLDLPVPALGQFPHASWHTVSPDYFRAMGIPVLHGRVFDGTERALTLPTGVAITPQTIAAIFKDAVISVVVSQNMAERFWPGEDPVGKRIRLGPPNLQLPSADVIGIVGNTVQTGLADGQVTEFYLALRQWPVPINMHMVVRSKLAPEAIASSVRTAANSVLRDEPVRDIRVLSERIMDSTAGRRFNRDLLACFAGTALLLAVVGLYGVLAFTVGRRTKEIGIRMALGATRREVVRRVMARGMALVLPGLAIGLGFAWAVGRLLQSQLFEVQSSDPMTFTFAALLMLLVAFLAAFVPASRASRVDPMEALRHE